MGKNYVESAKLIDKNVLYTPKEALDLVVKTSKAKFDETVELASKTWSRSKTCRSTS